MILINSSPKDALKIFQPFLPIFVPVGAGYLFSYAESQNIKIKLIDEQVEEDVLARVAEYVKDLKPPYIFGFSVLTAALKNAVLISQELKRIYPDSVILFGGIHPTALPEEVLSYKHIDFVIRGEGEKALVEFYNCIKENRDVRHLSGLSYRVNATVVHNKISQDPVNLDELPPFPYHLFKSSRYDLSFVVSSRGCPYRCIFCSNRVTTGKRYRYASAKKIVYDLDWLYSKYLAQRPGKSHVIFLDDNFLVNKERIYELLSEIKRSSLDKKLTFGFQARGDNAEQKLLKDLFDTGFKSIFFGLETASERIMKLIKKDETVAQCVKAVKMAKQIGFHISATFIYGLPGETHSDRMDCLKLSKELRLDMVRYNNATPYPGTELYEMAKKEGRLKVQGLYENFISVSTFIESPFSEIPFSYVPAGNSEQEIRDDILYSYFIFYSNFNKVKEILINPNKGLGWFNAGETALKLIKSLPALFLLAANILLKFCKAFVNIMLRKLKGLFNRNKKRLGQK